MKFATFYNNLSELPMHNFIQVLCTGKHQFIKRKGYATKSQLADMWEKLMEEYTDLSGFAGQNEILSIIKEISYLGNRLIIIRSIVEQMYVIPNNELADQLRGMGFTYKFDPSNSEQYDRDLKLVLSRSKTMIIRIEEQKKELELIESNAKTNEIITQSEYDVYLTTLSKFMGYRIGAKECSVSEFIAIVKRFKEENDPKNVRKNR